MTARTGNGSDKVVRLTAERLRHLEQKMAAMQTAQAGTNARLDQTILRLDQVNERLEEAVSVLTRLVQIVKEQNDRMKRSSAALNERFDRFTKSMLTGRTRDTQRLGRADRRLEVAERRLTVLEHHLGL